MATAAAITARASRSWPRPPWWWYGRNNGERTGEILPLLMAAHPFRIVNVFTENQGPLTGNALCVFENGAALSTEVMQALARQFNLSETTFILPPNGTGANA